MFIKAIHRQSCSWCNNSASLTKVFQVWWLLELILPKVLVLLFFLSFLIYLLVRRGYLNRHEKCHLFPRLWLKSFLTCDSDIKNRTGCRYNGSVVWCCTTRVPCHLPMDLLSCCSCTHGLVNGFHVYHSVDICL